MLRVNDKKVIQQKIAELSKQITCIEKQIGVFKQHIVTLK
jgi:regulator of replication initiation timing